MDLYSRIKNIYGRNNEAELAKAITVTREKLDGLVEERMCKVYSAFLLMELNSQHVPARLVNTLDLGLDYEHEFILVPANDDGYYLADLTFSQFNDTSIQLRQLLATGYQFMDEISLNSYLWTITKGSVISKTSCEKIFYSDNQKNNSVQFKM